MVELEEDWDVAQLAECLPGTCTVARSVIPALYQKVKKHQGQPRLEILEREERSVKQTSYKFIS